MRVASLILTGEWSGKVGSLGGLACGCFANISIITSSHTWATLQEIRKRIAFLYWPSSIVREA